MTTIAVYSKGKILFQYEFDGENLLLSINKPYGEIEDHITRLQKKAEVVTLRVTKKDNLKKVVEVLEQFEEAATPNDPQYSLRPSEAIQYAESIHGVQDIDWRLKGSRSRLCYPSSNGSSQRTAHRFLRG